MRTKTEMRRIRENQILSQLDKFGVMTVDHFQKMNIAGFGSSGKRNVLRVLGEMEKDGLIYSKHVGKKLFSTSRNFGYWEHRLLLIDFIVFKGYWKNCHIERPLMSKGVEVIKPDCIITEGDRMLCIEVDRRQKKVTNLQKVKRYKELGLQLVVVCYKDRSDHFPNCSKVFIEEMYN